MGWKVLGARGSTGRSKGLGWILVNLGARLEDGFGLEVLFWRVGGSRHK